MKQEINFLPQYNPQLCRIFPWNGQFLWWGDDMELRTSLRYPNSRLTPPSGHQTLKTENSIVPRLRQTIKTYSEKKRIMQEEVWHYSGSHRLIQIFHNQYIMFQFLLRLESLWKIFDKEHRERRYKEQCRALSSFSRHIFFIDWNENIVGLHNFCCSGTRKVKGWIVFQIFSSLQMGMMTFLRN